MAKQIEATYGNALFELAVEEGRVDALYEEAKALGDIIKDNEELVKLLAHPHIAKESKVEVVKQTFDGRISDELTGLLVMVVEKNHARNIVGILEYFVKQVKKYKRIGVVDVTSAMELDASQKAAVEKRILDTTPYESLEMIYHQDKSIIGGMIIRIEDRVVDSSVKTKLESMSKALSRA